MKKVLLFVLSLMLNACTTDYVLMDEENLTMHYIHLEIMSDLKETSEFLPKGYYDSGRVEGQDYSIFDPHNKF